MSLKSTISAHILWFWAVRCMRPWTRNTKRYKGKGVDILISVLSIDRMIAINTHNYSITLYYKARSVANLLEVWQSLEIRRLMIYKYKREIISSYKTFTLKFCFMFLSVPLIIVSILSSRNHKTTKWWSYMI